MKITQKMLLDAGGWQAMKAGQALVDARRTSEITYEPPLLRGSVKEGATAYRAGLKIQSASRIENLCSCRESRQWGKICAHSLAIGLAHLQPPAAAESAPAVGAISAVALPAPAAELALVADATRPDFLLHLILPPALAAAESTEEVMVVAEIERGGKRAPLSTLDAKKPVRCALADVLPVQLLYSFGRGKLPGMAMFSRAEFAQFAAVVGSHPRVTFGRSQPANLPELARRLSPAPEQKTASAAAESVVAQASFALEIEGSLNHLAAKLSILRRGAPFAITPGSPFADGSVEQCAVGRIERLGFSPGRAGKEWVMQGEMAIVRFFANALPDLQRDWKVSLGPRFTNITADIERVEPQITIRDAGERWFDLDVSLATQDGGRFSQDEIQRLLRSGQHWTRKKNGKLAVFDGELLEEFQQALAQSAPRQSRPGEYRVERRHALHLHHVLEDRAVVAGSETWRDWVSQASQPGTARPIPLGDFENILRPYQKQGVYWLHFLAQHQLGGILADEMGLGKTVQTLAFLAAQSPSSAPSLVVCPSSLVFNWRQEAQRFTPQLKVVQYEGGELLASQANLIITSYGMLRRNAETLDALRYHVVILDEAQHIKNASTQNARFASALQANARFALTGTPLENSLLDLWSLMNFALPGYLGEKKAFAEQYMQAQQGEGDKQPRSGLAARVAPYLLRRRKDEILKELPQKTIQVLLAPMTSRQGAMHAALVNHAQQELTSLLGNSKNKLKIFAVLTRLRQAACDIRLIDPASTPEADAASGKLKLLEELLAEIIDANRRVLIFSQFVGMLHLIEAQLKEADIPFCYLDGSTANREEVVGRFKSTPSIPVFLISLKAGGFGLNLTEADTVIHFDPWWNPAVEAQASDRIHRIGQTRPVTIYKLISAGSIEEKMLKLQQRKSAALSSILEESQAAEKLTIEEIRSLVE